MQRPQAAAIPKRRSVSCSGTLDGTLPRRTEQAPQCDLERAEGESHKPRDGAHLILLFRRWKRFEGAADEVRDRKGEKDPHAHHQNPGQIAQGRPQCLVSV